MSLGSKTLFVTGASRGIGLAIALRAARDGANIAIAAKTVKPDPRLPGTIFTAAEEIEKAGGKALPLACDIRDEQSVDKAVAETVAKFGGIDILVNNASAISLTGTLATPMKRYDLMHQINARGTFMVSQKCIPHLLKAANPHVLNLSPPLDFDVKWFANHAGLHARQVRHVGLRLVDGGGIQGQGHRPSTACGRAPPSPPPPSRTSWAATRA